MDTGLRLNRAATLPAAALLLLALCLLGPAAARAQWTTTGNNISNTNSGNVGIGTGSNSPSGKLDVRQIGNTGLYSTILTSFGANEDTYIRGGSAAAVVHIGDLTATTSKLLLMENGGIVGVGTASPGIINGVDYSSFVALHVKSTASSKYVMIDSNGPNSGFAINDSSQPVDNRLWAISQAAGGGKLTFTTFTDGGVNTNRVVIDRSGNVGIGTSSPSRVLSVEGNGYVVASASAPFYEGFRLRANDSATNGGYLLFGRQTGNNTYATLQSGDNVQYTALTINPLGGKVGIGTTGPSYTLDVAGQVRSSSGGFVFPNGTVQTTAATITGVTAGTGLTGGGASGSVTLNVAAGAGITSGAGGVSVNYGSTAGTAVQGNTALTVSAGSGLSGGGTATLGSGGTITLSNTDAGSAQNIFKNVANAAGAAQFSAGTNNDAIRFEGTGGTSVSFDAATKKVTINSSAASSSGWTDGGSSVSLTNNTASVGIGTSPAASRKLHVLGGSIEGQFSATVGQGYGFFIARDNNHFVENAYFDGTAWRAIQSGKSAIIQTYTSGGYALYVQADNTVQAAGATRSFSPVFAVKMDGSLGIGTTSPLQRIQVGSNTAAATATPDAISLGATYSSVAGANPKLHLFDDNAGNVYGLGVSNSQLDLVAPAGARYVWNIGGAEKMRLDSSGNVGIGTTPGANNKLDVNGNANVSGGITAGGAITGATVTATYQDVAEWVPSTQKLPAGTVVILDTDHTNQVLASTKSYDTKVAGVVSAQPGISLGQGGEGKLLVATTGRVKVRVDATRAPIKVGDLLVTSDAEGVAMKSIPVDIGGTQIHRPGTIIGKALEPLEKGTGEILVLLSLQ